MAYKFNIFTGKFDLVDDSSSLYVDPLNFVCTGEPNAQFKESASLSPSAPLTVFYEGKGRSGCVDRIGLITTFPPEVLANIIVNVYHDGDLVTPYWSAPLVSMIGWKNWTNIISAQYTTSFWEVTATPADIVGQGVPTYFTIFFPHPYQNGMKMTFSTLYKMTQIQSFTINAAGSGYTAGDVVTVTQSSAQNGRITVNTVDGSGHVLTATLSNAGSGYVTANGLATTGGTGTGFKVNVVEADGVNQLYTNVEYRNTLADRWNKNFRLMVSESTVNVGAGDTHTWLSTPSNESGYIAATIGSFVDSANGTDYFEGNVQIKLNGVTSLSRVLPSGASHNYVEGDIVSVSQAGASGGTVMIDEVDGTGKVLACHVYTKGTGYTDNAACTVSGGHGSGLNLTLKPSIEYSSLEDYFNLGYFMSSPFRGREMGITCSNEPTAQGGGGVTTAYKMYHDNPIQYTAGATAYLPNESGSSISSSWLVYRYIST